MQGKSSAFPDAPSLRSAIRGQRSARAQNSTAAIAQAATPEIVAVQNEYMRLADQLWNGFEPITATPMKDRDLFEFLGFD